MIDTRFIFDHFLFLYFLLKETARFLRWWKQMRSRCRRIGPQCLVWSPALKLSFQ